MRHKLIIGCLLGMVVLMAACNPSPETPTPTPSDKEARLEERIAELEGKIAELSDTPKPDSQREEIISFTRQALEIEAKRNELMQYLAGLRDVIGLQNQRALIERRFVNGVPPGAHGVPPSGFEGMASLVNKLLMLDCPQSMQPVKNTLLHIYHAEIGQVQLQQLQSELWLLELEVWELQAEEWEFPPWSGPIRNLVYPEITKDNLDHWRQLKEQHGPVGAIHALYRHMVETVWFHLQESRRDIYVRWAEILQEHAVDAVKEGFVMQTTLEGDYRQTPGSIGEQRGEEIWGPLAIYMKKYGIEEGWQSPFQRAQMTYAKRLHDIFRLQQLMGLHAGHAEAVWEDYLQPFDPRRPPAYGQAAGVLRGLLGMTPEARADAGIDFGTGELGQLSSLLYLALRPHLGIHGAQGLVGRLGDERARMFRLEAEGAAPMTFLDYLRQRFNLQRFGF